MQRFEQSLTENIRSAILKLGYPDEEIVLSMTKPEIPSDVYTTIACQLSSKYKTNSAQKIASLIVKEIEKNPYISSIKAENNGFINIVLSPTAFSDCYTSLINPTPAKKNKHWKLIEVVSANPTGYLHIGHTRHGILTDTLGNIFEKDGHLVRREYLVNDDGNQIKELVKSFWFLWRKKQRLLTKDERDMESEISYQGVDMHTCVEYLFSKFKNKWFLGDSQILGTDIYNEVKSEVINFFLQHIKEMMDKYQIKIDHWRHESYFVNRDSIGKILRQMESRISYKDGAVWIDISPEGSEEKQEEVLIKKDGHHTYFAQDTIYHDLKLGLIGSKDEIIDVLGCDHYGHGEKLMGYIKARGHREEERIKIIWMQLVKLLSEGEALKMSKRDSTVIFMKDLEEYMTYEEVRWFFVSQASTTTLEIDIEKLKAKDYNNPVYYVMYAYSRICQILRKEDKSVYIDPSITFDKLNNQERSIFNHLIHFDSTIHSASQTYSPHKLPQYLFKLAQLFHPYYETTKILSGKKELIPQRLALLEAIRITIKEGLSLMRIEAREEL